MLIATALSTIVVVAVAVTVAVVEGVAVAAASVVCQLNCDIIYTRAIHLRDE